MWKFWRKMTPVKTSRVLVVLVVAAISSIITCKLVSPLDPVPPTPPVSVPPTPPVSVPPTPPVSVPPTPPVSVPPTPPVSVPPTPPVSVPPTPPVSVPPTPPVSVPPTPPVSVPPTPPVSVPPTPPVSVPPTPPVSVPSTPPVSVPPTPPVSVPPDLIQSIKDGDNCECVLKKTNGGSITVKQFNLKVPWLNMTTKEHLAKRHPNLPVDFLYQASQGKACDLIPSFSSIEWRDVYWQEVRLAGSTSVLLYSATYDPNPGRKEPCLRLLALTTSFQLPAAWCRLWYATNQPPVVARVTTVGYLDYQKKNSNRQMPFLITCPLPPQEAHRLPVAVSLVEKPCDPATNLLQVVGSERREPSAYQDGREPQDSASTKTGWVPALCGTALFYYQEDFSTRLVEWLEIMRVEGFAKVFLHVTQVHPNLQKVLQHYEAEGFLHVTDYTYPPPYVNEPSIRRLWTLLERQKMFAQENIYFTDCLLRHMHEYRFIAHYDPDEIPILPKHDNFTHFLNDLLTQSYTKSNMMKKPVAYMLRWSYFHNDLEPVGEAAKLPEYLWALRHTRRPVEYVPFHSGSVKTLYDMDIVRGVYSHGVLQCTTGKCSRESMVTLLPEIAYLGHFKFKCGSKCKAKNSTKEELSLHKYKEPVAKAVTRVLQQLELV